MLQMDTRKKTVITWVPTWLCNLKCSYCDYRAKAIRENGSVTGYEMKCFGETWRFGRQLNWLEWIAYLSRFRPYHLELTGGEPLMYPHLAELLAHVAADSSWAITSNTLGEVRLFEPGNCKFWTASYHYTQHDKFVKNVTFLRQRGFPIRVTLVLTPENEKTCFEAIRDFRKNDVMVNLHPVLKQGFSWERHPELLARARAAHDGVWVVFVDDVPKEWKPRQYSNCKAGGDYFALMPDGTVLRCYSALLWHGKVGHISDYQPTKLFAPCSKPCVFHCDNRAEKNV